MIHKNIGDAEWFALVGLQYKHDDDEIKQMLFSVCACIHNQQKEYKKAKNVAEKGLALESEYVKSFLQLEITYAIQSLANDPHIPNGQRKIDPNAEGSFFLKIAREKLIEKEFDAALTAANHGLELELTSETLAGELLIYQKLAISAIRKLG